MPTDPNDVRTNDLEKWLYPAAGAPHSWIGSYLGFEYNGRHSSEFGIVRTSTSNRYDDGLLPNKSVKTTAVPGGDGAYYFGSNYTQRQFSINFAFDALTDLQLRELRQWLGQGEIHDLIFDEFPYKVYSAAVTGNATAKHLCFDEGSGVVYRGEGTIQFTCYFPFARSRFKFLNQYNSTNISYWNDLNNANEWANGSKLLSTQGTIDTPTITGAGDIRFSTRNMGDVDVDWCLYIDADIASRGILLRQGIQNFYPEKQLLINPIAGLLGNEGIIVNSKNRVLQKYTLSSGIYVPENVLYNHFIAAGDFFQIPLTTGNGTNGDYLYIIKQSGADFTTNQATIKYDYLYY